MPSLLQLHLEDAFSATFTSQTRITFGMNPRHIQNWTRVLGKQWQLDMHREKNAEGQQVSLKQDTPEPAHLRNGSLSVPTCLPLRGTSLSSELQQWVRKESEVTSSLAHFLLWTPLDEMEPGGKGGLSQGMWTPAPILLLPGHGVRGVITGSPDSASLLEKWGSQPEILSFPEGSWFHERFA